MPDIWTPLANMLGSLILKYSDQLLNENDKDDTLAKNTQQSNLSIIDKTLENDSSV